jgi:hypothetical protein
MNDPLWMLFLIVSGRGGVGKSLISMLLAVTLLLKGREPKIIEADMQRRLEFLFPDRTQTIEIDQLEALADGDPLALTRAFSLIPRAAREAAAVGNADLIIDAAATWDGPIIRYVTEVGLFNTVTRLHGRLVFLVPITADADAVLLAVDTAEQIERMVPQATIVFVLNAHPQPVRFDLPAVKTVYGGVERVNALLARHRRITLRAIPDRIWGNFERAGMSVLDVSTADPKDLLAVADADIDTVGIMQGRIQSWLNAFIQELEPLLQFREPEGQAGEANP